MIDFVKIRLPSFYIPELRNNSNLEWKGLDNRTTGEIEKYPLSAKYSNLEFTVYSPDFILLTGSLHKFSKNGYNVEDYFFRELFDTVKTLYEIFNINPFLAHLNNVEYGVNINPPIKTKRLIHQIIEYKGKPFSLMPGKNQKQLGIHCSLQRFTINDKKNQWPHLGIEKETMRFEIKVKKTVDLQKEEIFTLADLLNPSKLFQLGESLSSYFNQLLFLDKSLQTTHLKKIETELLNHWSNPIFIRDQRETNRKKYERERRKIRELQELYSTDRIQEKTLHLIKSKWIELSILDDRTCTKLTGFLSQFPEFDFDLFNRSNSMLFPSIYNHVKRVCKITGEDISDQRKGSKFISAKKIGYREAHS